MKWIARCTRRADYITKRHADVRDRLRNTGLEPVAQTPGHFPRLVESELKRWNQVIKEARIQTE